MKNIFKYITEKLVISKDIELQKQDPNDPATWAVDDILCGTYYYSMVLPVFYKIVGRTAKTFNLVKLQAVLASGHYNGQFTEVPDEKVPENAKVIKARINKRNNIVVNNVTLRLWDGKPLAGDDMD